MVDAPRAAHLVLEDSLASRGGGAYAVIESETISDSTGATDGKGKGREVAQHPEQYATARMSDSDPDSGRPRRRSTEHRWPAPDIRSGRSDATDKRRLRRLWWRAAFVNVLYICAWYCFSTLISVYNKWMFAEDHFNFPYPLFVTSIHMLVQWLLAALVLSIFPRLRPSTRPAASDYATKVAPCGMATGLDIGLSNLSLRTITLSFYTMCKSSGLAFVLLFAFLFKLEKPSWRLAGIILIITSGVILMVSTETQFHFVGMVEVFTASALGGLRWSLTQILLDKEGMGMGNPIATLFWLAPVMGITLALCSMVFDGWFTVFANETFFGSFGITVHTFLAVLFPGLIAFMMNVTEFGLIQRTSVVTLSVAGIFKEVAVIFLSTIVFHDVLTPINVSGLVVTIFGIALYNYLKYRQFTNAHGSTAVDTRSLEGARKLSQTQEDEEAPMLPHERGEYTQSLPLQSRMQPQEAPLHSLGDDEDEEGLRRSTSSELSLDTLADELGLPLSHSSRSNSLIRTSAEAKRHQHDADRVPHLSERIDEDAQLVKIDDEIEGFEQELRQRKQDGWL
ncbi:uncharacterized protein JCM15063_000212 [Sporobolomyces koalae]|uniref:uncharacterized protein n=1 Tax=Sporobolomyces koalae TaxID=500713 RepID=UPI00316DF632